ncbi:MAG: preprotein translocase subunit SecA, partial [Porticoccaceae bacterium]|nr:preprotein translocase subunit SecA [Porticoccaceae bacterium]
MFANMFKKVFGSKNDREIRKLGKTVVQINQLEAGLAALSDADLKAETLRLRGKLEDGSSLDQLLPEAFALVRETSNRVMGMRHFDVQMIGGMALHQGRIAEMRTGEGKTLVATLAAYLNALPANGVHVITVNDYLARRDAQWMAPLYQALGLSVGVIQSYQGPDSPNSFLMDQGDETLRPSSRREAYAADITYGTNNEFGFDYLRDNMALRQDDKSQRGLSFAIVDEVDSILIDEARTPLVISGAAQDSSSLYRSVNALTLKLASGTEEEPGDFIVDEKTRSVELSEDGFQKV